MTNHRFTPKLLRTLQFIKKYVDENHIPPSIVEVADHFKINPTAANARIRRCIILGYLASQPAKARSLTFTPSGLTKIKAEGDYYDN